MAKWAGDFSPILHPCVVGAPFRGERNEKARACIVMVMIRCPRCQTDRSRPASEVRRETKRPNFRGLCRPCAIAGSRDGSHRWNIHPKKRTVFSHNHGYRLVSARDVPDDLLPMYRLMQKSNQPVMEHRWNMALHLGRALESRECIDHMDGDKTNNAIENLRLYVKGKQQPGSANGYGTYYHEWQTALVKIRKLEALLSARQASG